MVDLKAKLWILMDKCRLPSMVERLCQQQGWCILWGHGVCGDAVELLEHYPRHIHISVFRAQMHYLLSRGYQFISLTEGVRRLEAGLPMDRLVTVTFDDGFRNVVQLAYPVMAECNLKGCIYAVTDYIGTEQVLWTDRIDILCLYSRRRRSLKIEFPDQTCRFSLEDRASQLASATAIKRKFRSVSEALRLEYFRQLEGIPLPCFPEHFRFSSWEELGNLDPAILEVGNHTQSHPNLANVDDAEHLEREIVGAKCILEQRLGYPIRHFCYPAGSYNSQVIEQVSQSGHLTGATIHYGFNSPGAASFELTRLGLPATLSQFKARMSGFEAALLQARGLLQN